MWSLVIYLALVVLAEDWLSANTVLGEVDRERRGTRLIGWELVERVSG